MWELDYKESREPKNWCFWTVVLEKTLESPSDCKEIQAVHSKDQSWVFIGRTDAEAETPILWPPDAKNWLIWKDPDAEKDWGQEEEGTIEVEIVGWHHELDGHGMGRLRKLVMDREAWRAGAFGTAKSWIDWATELNWTEWLEWMCSWILFKKSPGSDTVLEDIFKTDFISSVNVVPFSFYFVFDQILIVNFLLFISLNFSNLQT